MDIFRGLISNLCLFGNIIYYFAVVQTIVNLRYRFFDARKLDPEEETDIAGDVVVVTGGNRGLGKASAMEFAKRNAVIVLGCNNMKTGLAAVEEIKKQTGNNNVEAIHLDLSDMDSVEKFSLLVSIKYPKIKILLNNAGVGGANKPWAKKKTREGFNVHVAVNHLGHFLLTNLLLENIKKANSARVVTISSIFQVFSQLDVDDLMMEKSGFGVLCRLPYCNTKLVNSLFMKELGERLKNSGVTTYSLCPDAVNTDILDSLARSSIESKLIKLCMDLWARTPEEAASQFVMYGALYKKIGNETGLMYRSNRVYDHLNVPLENVDLRIKLWDISTQLVGLDERMERLQSRRIIK